MSEETKEDLFEKLIKVTIILWVVTAVTWLITMIILPNPIYNSRAWDFAMSLNHILMNMTVIMVVVTMIVFVKRMVMSSE